jgi:hypothetical protein
VHDDDELVALCVDEYEDLTPAFKLGNGTSMRIKHLRSYTEASLKAHVMSHGGPDGLVPPWLDSNNLRRLLRMEQRQIDPLGQSVRHGQPPIDVGSISSSSASIPNNHKKARVEVRDADFALFESIGPPRDGVSHVLWGNLANSLHERLQWSSESDICGFVTLFLREVARELNLALEFRAEVGFFNLRPDLTVVKMFGVPVGVVEVKRPTKGILDNGAVLGELYDYMKQVVNFYGLKQVFGILTTYQEWRVCWMSDEHSAKLVSDMPVENTDTEPHTPVKAGERKEKTSPQGLTPSKTMKAPHGLDRVVAEDGDNDEAVQMDDAERVMMSTRVLHVDENVFNLVGSALWKMNDAQVDNDMIGRGQMVIQVTEDSFFWCKRPKATFYECLKWNKVPRAKRLLLLEDLGVGHSGRVWLVGSQSGLVGVLKFSVAKATGNWRGSLEEFQKRAMDIELAWWHKIYPALGEMCSVQQFAGYWTLLMPHLCTPERNEDTLKLVEMCLRENFANRGLKHRDVAWRNVGVYRQENGHDACIVYDLESVEESKSSDWVESAVDELRERIS